MQQSNLKTKVILNNLAVELKKKTWKKIKNYFNNFINEEVSDLLSPLFIKSK